MLLSLCQKDSAYYISSVSSQLNNNTHNALYIIKRIVCHLKEFKINPFITWLEENCLKSKTTLEWWRSTLVKLQSNLVRFQCWKIYRMHFLQKFTECLITKMTQDCDSDSIDLIDKNSFEIETILSEIREDFIIKDGYWCEIQKLGICFFKSYSKQILKSQMLSKIC